MSMMKRFFALLLAAVLTLASCAPAAEPDATAPPDDTTEYTVAAIDHSVVEPDVAAVMSDRDRELYRAMTDAMLARRDAVDVSGSDIGVDVLLDELRRNPYGFLLRSARAEGGRVVFTYAYTEQEQADIVAFMDSELLDIVNCDAAAGDNTLDTILKVYYAVTHRLTYDRERDDNKQLTSPLFDYPGDEVYKALRDDKSLCYGFAYILCFALLQRGIDCFTVYGNCHAHSMGHMWNVFRYDGAFFTCDPAWDRSDDGFSKLYHFGKTDDERFADTLEARDFGEYHYAAYGEVKCTDERFSIFRNINRFSYVREHDFFLESIDNDEFIFDTSTFTLK